jgi:hypothetical protein
MITNNCYRLGTVTDYDEKTAIYYDKMIAANNGKRAKLVDFYDLKQGMLVSFVIKLEKLRKFV